MIKTLHKKMIDNTNVLEIDYNDFKKAKMILNEIRLKPKRFSKYLRGLSF